jgi:hypothetical protein
VGDTALLSCWWTRLHGLVQTSRPCPFSCLQSALCCLYLVCCSLRYDSSWHGN